MEEFMFYVSNAYNGKAHLNEEQHLAFVHMCELYINELINANQLIAAQPLDSNGVVINKSSNELMVTPISKGDDIEVGYYHIRASSMEEEISIAKRNPEFEFISSARITIRSVRLKEAKTDFIYPVLTG